MARTSGRGHRNPCSFCSAPCDPAHCLITIRLSSGVWRRLYRLCWDCGYRELQHARTQYGGTPLPYVYQYVEVEG